MKIIRNMLRFFIFLIIALLFYLLYMVLVTAFEEVGFNGWEAGLIVFSCIIFGSVNIELFSYGKWIIAINVGGALLPILISLYLMLSRKVFGKSLVGIIIVAYFAYEVTYATSAGIVSEFPYWLIPPFVASLYSVAVSLKNKKKAASIAYSSGTLGVLIGADLLHINEILQMPKGGVASIGGAAILDMVFLTGIIAVLIDAFLYGRD